MIGACVEVARPAGGPAVASNLHVPEERLAEHNEGLVVRDVSSESRWLRHGYASKRSNRALRGHGCRQPETRASEEAHGYSPSVHAEPDTSLDDHGWRAEVMLRVNVSMVL